MLLQKETLDDFCKKVYLTLYFIFRYFTFYISVLQAGTTCGDPEIARKWGVNEEMRDEIAKSIYNICRENLDIRILRK